MDHSTTEKRKFKIFLKKNGLLEVSKSELASLKSLISKLGVLQDYLMLNPLKHTTLQAFNGKCVKRMKNNANLVDKLS